MRYKNVLLLKEKFSSTFFHSLSLFLYLSHTQFLSVSDLFCSFIIFIVFNSSENKSKYSRLQRTQKPFKLMQSDLSNAAIPTRLKQANHRNSNFIGIWRGWIQWVAVNVFVCAINIPAMWNEKKKVNDLANFFLFFWFVSYFCICLVFSFSLLFNLFSVLFQCAWAILLDPFRICHSFISIGYSIYTENATFQGN